MPELPELEILARRLTERCANRTVSRVELASISALKTYTPPISDLENSDFIGCHRRGKYLVMDIGPNVLVVHLARAGWIHWRKKISARRAAPGRGPLVLRLAFVEGDGFEITEMGTEKRASLHVAKTEADIEPLQELGVEPLSPAFSAAWLADLLAGEKGDVKHALSRQSLIAGVGNAYSDEALHLARLSPFKTVQSLSAEEITRLHAAVIEVLSGALARASDLDFDELKDSKRQSMRVHGRTGEACRTCGDSVREISFATRSLQYCPTCQTAGRQLADRRLSRLLK